MSRMFYGSRLPVFHSFMNWTYQPRAIRMPWSKWSDWSEWSGADWVEEMTMSAMSGIGGCSLDASSTFKIIFQGSSKNQQNFHAASSSFSSTFVLINSLSQMTKMIHGSLLRLVHQFSIEFSLENNQNDVSKACPPFLLLFKLIRIGRWTERFVGDTSSLPIDFN